MDDLKGKTAFVTGAASGIGRGMARTFARQGMNVALADIQEGALADARRDVESLGGRAVAIPVDVSDRGSVGRAAEQAVAAFGKVHVVCNNAGVEVAGKKIGEFRPDEWDWVLGVNLHGVIHGVETFLPLIRNHGEGGHIVNTASIAGLQVRHDFLHAPYVVAKYGVVALSEALAGELAGTNIGVSVLCPAAVNTRIWDTGKTRPARFGGPVEQPHNRFLQPILEREGLHPDRVGERVVQAIRGNELFVLTHAGPRATVEARHRRIEAAFDRAAAFEAGLARRR
jgi:NAD(P)-dependent dehydrogenase (short-subunit alcohol dehydrogenase family)